MANLTMTSTCCCLHVLHFLTLVIHTATLYGRYGEETNGRQLKQLAQGYAALKWANQVGTWWSGSLA